MAGGSDQGKMSMSDTVGGVNIALTVDASTVGPTLQAAKTETIAAAKEMDASLSGVGVAAAETAVEVEATAGSLGAMATAAIPAVAITYALHTAMQLLDEQMRAGGKAREEYIKGFEKYWNELGDAVTGRGASGTGFSAAREYEREINRLKEAYFRARDEIVANDRMAPKEKDQRLLDLERDNLAAIAQMEKAKDASIESEYAQRRTERLKKEEDAQQEISDRIKSLQRQRTLEQLEGLDKINERERQQLEDLDELRTKLTSENQKKQLADAIEATKQAAEFEREQFRQKVLREDARKIEEAARDREREQREAEAQRRRDEQEVRRAQELASQIAQAFNRRLDEQLGSFATQHLTATIEKLNSAIELQNSLLRNRR